MPMPVLMSRLSFANIIRNVFCIQARQIRFTRLLLPNRFAFFPTIFAFVNENAVFLRKFFVSERKKFCSDCSRSDVASFRSPR